VEHIGKRGLEEKMEAIGIPSAKTESDYLVRQAQEKAMAGDHFLAVKYLKEAIDLYPRNANAHLLLGNCQDCLEKVEDAIISYDKALAIDPDNAEAWFNKGMTLKKIGNLKEATLCIEKCIDLYCGR
jgi:tetratricopeptide (TPR) repeat protein